MQQETNDSITHVVEYGRFGYKASRLYGVLGTFLMISCTVYWHDALLGPEQGTYKTLYSMIKSLLQLVGYQITCSRRQRLSTWYCTQDYYAFPALTGYN